MDGFDPRLDLSLDAFVALTPYRSRRARQVDLTDAKRRADELNKQHREDAAMARREGERPFGAGKHGETPDWKQMPGPTRLEKIRAARTVRKRANRAVRVAKKRAKECKRVAGIESLALDPCAYCGDPAPTTHDHVVPFSKGGSHGLDNLVRACWPCNREKGTQSLLHFLAKRAARKAA